MNKEREMKTLVIAALVISVVAIGVGFAAFSTTLQINGTATVNTKTWNVYFEKIEKTTASTEGVESSAPTITNGTVGANTTAAAISTITAAFTAPGQKLQYKITVKNAGNSVAKLTAANIATELTAAGTGASAETDAANVKKHSTFTFTKADSSAVNVGTDTIAPGETQDYLYTLEYKNFDLGSDLPAAAVTLTVPQITLTFSQAE